MNRVTLIGRLTADPDVRYSTGENAMAIGRYTLAVDRPFKKDGDEQTADFIRCVAFGKNGEFAEKFLTKGMKIAVEGRIQTGKYTNQEGNTIYTTDVVVERHEFVESKSSTEGGVAKSNASNDGFMDIPEGLENELPFK